MTDVQAALAFLDRISDRGRRLRSSLASDRADAAATDPLRRWQTEVAGAVNELSGGSKAHWLSKAFTGALLIPSPRGDGVLGVEAPAIEIVDRLLDVIEQARASLTQVAAGVVAPAAPEPRRFEFVHDASIRPVLEQAYGDGERALAASEADQAFRIFCSVLESIISDALKHARLEPAGDDRSFDERIGAAETAGLIRAGCGRLPASARRYRDREDSREAATIRDATIVRQVLRVVMRDLDPGR